MHNRLLNAIVFVAACAASTGASAHIGPHDLAQTGFLTGFMHPLTGLALGWALRGANVWLARAAGGAVAVFGTALLVPMT